MDLLKIRDDMTIMLLVMSNKLLYINEINRFENNKTVNHINSRFTIKQFGFKLVMHAT